MKYNIEMFRIVDNATQKVLLETSVYFYFYQLTKDNTSPNDKTLEAITDDGKIMVLNDLFIDDDLNDFTYDSLKPVALMLHPETTTGYMVVPQS